MKTAPGFRLGTQRIGGSPGWRNLRRVALGAAFSFVLRGLVVSQTYYYWSGDGANDNWRTSGNFKSSADGTTNSTPPTNSSQTQLVFGARAAARTTANNADNDFDVSGIIFEPATDGAGTTFTISGSRIQFKRRFLGSDPLITQNSAMGHTISAPIRLDDPLTLGGDGTGMITLSGAWTGGNEALIKSGSSAFLITQSATSAGSVTINGGTLALSGSGAVNLIQLRGGVLAQSGTFSRTLGTGSSNVNFGAGGGGFAAYGGDLTVSTNLGTWGSTANSLQSGTALILGSSIATNRVTLTQNLNLGGAARTITLVDNANSSADVARISGALSNGGLTVNGNGVLELTGTNTYTGVTTINGGTVSVATIGNGGTAGNLGQASNAAGNLVLGGGTLQYTGATASTDRSFTLTSGTTSSIDVTANNLTITGASANTTGSLIKLGAGTLTLTGANGHHGTTTVNAGVLQIGNGSTSGVLHTASAIEIGAAGTLRFNRSDTITQGSNFSGLAISGEGKLEQSGPGTTVLNVANTYSGGTIIHAGTLLANSLGGSATGSGDVTVKSGGTLGGGFAAIAGNTVVESGGNIRAGGGTAGDFATLAFAGDLSLDPGSTWLLDLAQSGTSVDKLAVAGELSLGGSLSILGQGSYEDATGNYVIASYGSLSGRFSNDLISNDSNLLRFGRIDAGDGKFWQVDYEDGGRITLTALAAVPEGEVWLPALVVLGLGFLARGRRRKGQEGAAVRP